MVGNDNKANNYYNISNGKIVRSYGGNKPEGIETTERVNKNGNTVYEQHFDFIKGKLIKADLKTHEEYGDSIELTITDGSDIAVLQFKFDSSYGRSFLYKTPNLDIKQVVNIKPYSFVSKDTGKTILGMTIYNPLEKVPNYYTREEPNGMPELKPIKLKGKDTWDNSDQLEFLQEKYKEFCAKFLNVESDPVEDDTDDLPF